MVIVIILMKCSTKKFEKFEKSMSLEHYEQSWQDNLRRKSFSIILI